MVRNHTLVKVDSLVFHPAALDDLKADIRRLKGERATTTVDVRSFKDRYGVTRKYAIPLLEYLDRERVTRRVGESRIVTIGRGLAVVAAVFRRFLEVADALADAPADLRQAAGTKDQDDQEENDDQFGNPETHGGSFALPEDFG